MEFLFLDEEDWAEMEADKEKEEERRRREEEEKMRKEKEYRRRREAHEAVMDSIIEHDPKVERDVYTRFFLRDFSSLTSTRSVSSLHLHCIFLG